MRGVLPQIYLDCNIIGIRIRPVVNISFHYTAKTYLRSHHPSRRTFRHRLSLFRKNKRLMEPIGFTAGIVALAGLFSTCVECWEYFESAQSLERDYALLATKLQVEKTRLLMWGNAVGVVTTDRRDINLDLPHVPPLVEKILNCMIVIFTDSEALVSKYGLQQTKTAEHDSHAPGLIAQRTTLSSNQLSKFKMSVKQFQALFKGHQQKITLFERTRWAIRDRGKFGVFVDDLRQLIDGLREITSSSTNGTQERNAIAEELESLPDLVALKLVRDASANVHQDWSDSATEIIEMSVVGGEDRQDVMEWMRDTDDQESTLQTAEDTLLQAGLDIDSRGFENLHWAAIHGHDHVVKFLLDNGVSADARGPNSSTALLQAVQSGNTNVIQLLIDRGANVECIQWNRVCTPLLEAVRSEKKDVVAQLLKNIVRVDARSSSFETPLFIAAQLGNVDIIKLLIDHGANSEVRHRSTRTPLYEATSKGHMKAVKLLLQEGANIECICEDGATPLLEASRRGHEAVVQFLLEQGVNTEVRTEKGRTSLNWAVKEGHIAVIRTFLEHGVDVEAPNSKNMTLLHEAASCEDRAEIIRMLVQYGADLEARNMNQSTPLIEAVMEGHKENVEALLEAGSTIDSIDCWGSTALLLAIQNERESIFYYLFEKGANVRLCNCWGDSSLHRAAMKGNWKFVQEILGLGVDINQLNYTGRTPLWLAAFFGNLEIVKVLLEEGASKSILDHSGQTPMSAAIRGGHTEVVRLLS